MCIKKTNDSNEGEGTDELTKSYQGIKLKDWKWKWKYKGRYKIKN